MSRRKSLSEQISTLSDPTPRDIDPESLTSFHDNTTASYIPKRGDDNDHNKYGDTMNRDGRLLLQAEPDALNDPRYSGKKISRKDLQPEGDISSSDSDDSGDHNGSSSDDSDNSVDSSGEESDANNLGSFGSDSEEEEEEDPLDRRLSTFSNASSMSTPAQSAEAQEKSALRAKHTLNQKKIWTELLGVRVQLQPLVEMGNRLPNSQSQRMFRDHSDENVEAYSSAIDSLTSLLRTCVSVSKTLSGQHDDIKLLPQKRKRKRRADALDDIWDEMDTNYENFSPYRDAVLTRWNSKTQLQSGQSLNKKFKIINQGILSQIQSILSNETRLLKRTRIKRNNHTIIGEDLRRITNNNEEEEKEVIVDEDHEIFDDTDFFKQYRQEYLESTLSGDQFLALSNSYATKRIKKKKKIDTKATKGRRLKYVVMSKLQNFCAPEYVGSPSIDVDVLLGSLFGGH
jgi:protein AATF/BFR2